jgi:membrane fusion protein (multidrug efflux system)
MSNVQNIEEPGDDLPKAVPLSDQMSASQNAKSRLRTKLRMLGALAVMGVVGVWFVLTSGGTVETDNAYIQSDKVEIAAEIDGRAAKVLARTNQGVSAGDELFHIEDTQYRIALATAEAHLADTINTIQALKDGFGEKQARLGTAEEQVASRDKELQRQQQLRQRGVSSETRLDEARREFTMARQQLAIIREDIATIRARLSGNPDGAVEDNPQVMAAQAELDQAHLDLDHTIIRSPIDGVIAKVNLQPGEYIRTGQPIFSLVGADDIWITANFKETDLTWVRIGQKAIITVDQYPDHEWIATVASISPATGSEFSLIPAQNASGNWVKVVQRVPVRLYLDQQYDDAPLRAGLSTIVEIDIERQGAPRRWISETLGF